MFAIRVSDLSVGQRDNSQNEILKKINGQFEKGSMTAILGPNGAGKSTLIKAITGVIQPSSGSIEIAPDLTSGIGLLPQKNEIDHAFPITVFDLVAMGAWKRVGAFRAYSSQERDYIHQALTSVGLQHNANQLIGTLSGGQFQRALFARLIVRRPDVYILDEPFTAIDEHTSAELMQIMLDWHATGKTVIVVLHDVELARQVFPQTLLLAREVVAWGETQSILTEDNLQKARRLALQGF
ncbi:ABC transporter [Pelistega indica]|uniref:ABC transporter n=1 Tax=Pelistega indica TaxID=1414851 RepID=V8FZQ9_9BURK|nr:MULTISPECIES: metal ABC transporter ATP-binding protein [Pelistega]ETD68922.1 ABC transporter [Pelistega indica]